MLNAFKLLLGPYLDGLWEHWRGPMLGSVLSGTIGTIQSVAFLLTPLPAKLSELKIWTPPIWAWFIVSLCLLAYAQFRMWLDGHNALEKEQESHTNSKELHKLAIGGLERDLSSATSLSLEAVKLHALELKHEQQKVLALEARLAEATVMIGRPYVDLSFSEIDFHTQPMDQWTGTELLASCTGKDAYAIQILPCQATSNLQLRSIAPTQKIVAGDSARMEYWLLDQDEQIEGLVGQLRKVFNMELQKTGKDSLCFPLTVKYLDASGKEFDTPMELFYSPKIPNTPMIWPIPRQRRATAESQVPESRQSTTHEN